MLKRIIPVLLLLCLVCPLFGSCSGDKEEETISLIDGVFKDDSLGPYVFINSGENSWRCGASDAMSFSLGGEYEIYDKVLNAYSSNDKSEPAIIFDILSERELKCTYVSEDFFKPIEPSDPWIKEGEIYRLRYPLSETGLDYLTIFETVCSADVGLEMARKNNVVVIENLSCTSGEEAWNTFYKTTVNDKKEANILCARYYTLDKKSVSPELYKEEKDEYPKLFFYYIVFDGETFQIDVRLSDEEEIDYSETFGYLKRFTGEAPDTANYSTYDNYALLDDPDVTWEDIIESYISSATPNTIKEITVFSNNK